MSRLPLLNPVAPGALPFPAGQTDPGRVYQPQPGGTFLVAGSVAEGAAAARLTLQRVDADGAPMRIVATTATALDRNPFRDALGPFGADRIDVQVQGALRDGAGTVLVWQEVLVASAVDDGLGGTAEQRLPTLVLERIGPQGDSLGRHVMRLDDGAVEDVSLRPGGGLDLLIRAGSPGSAERVIGQQLDARMAPLGGPIVYGAVGTEVAAGVQTVTRLLDTARLADGAVVLTVLETAYDTDSNALVAPPRLFDRVLNPDGSVRRADADLARGVDATGFPAAQTLARPEGGHATVFKDAQGQTVVQRFDAAGVPIGTAQPLTGRSLDDARAMVPVGDGHFLRLSIAEEAGSPAVLLAQEFTGAFEMVGPPAVLHVFAGGAPANLDADINAIPSIAIQIALEGDTGPLWSGDFAVARHVVLGDADNVLTLVNPQRIMAAGGNDSITGSAHDDTLFGGTGNDRLDGMGGDDILFGDAGDDLLDGGAGDDVIIGGESRSDLRDVIFAGDGNDTADGGYGNDEIYGGAGDDLLLGGWGVDTLVGNAGNDRLAGGAFSDLLFGGPGDDFLNGGFGFDRLNGGRGADAFYHLGVRDHGSDWVQDYARAEGDVLMTALAGGAAAFQINRAFTPGAGDPDVAVAFVIYRPTGQILWALVDGDAQPSLTLETANGRFDLT
jgi:Ca2+-binding RTX toxin-like protein